MSTLYANNAATTLAVRCSTEATSLTVTDGTEFPEPTAPDGFWVTLEEGDEREICWCTARDGNDLTVTRAQQGTTAAQWAVGTAVENRWTAADGEGLQPASDNLTAFADLTLVADRVPYADGAGTLSLTTLTSFGRSLIAAASAAAVRTLLSLVPGTDIQPFSSALTALAALSMSRGSFIRGTDSAWQSVTPTGRWGRAAVGGTTYAAGTFTLTAPLECTDLSIAADGILVTDGYPITVTGTLTLNGIIRDNGANAVGGTKGAALAAQGIRPASGAGADGRTTTGIGAQGSASAASWWLAVLSASTSTGGPGGTGGSAGGAGGVGPTVVTGLVPTIDTIRSFLGFMNAAGTMRRPGGGGGGGAGGATLNAGTATSGGGGSGGGIVQVAARILTGFGSFEAKGGAGGAASVTADAVAGGGGGGGGGQVMVAVGQTASWSGSMSATGGAGGAGAGGGAAGSAGTDGATLMLIEAA